VFTVQATKLAVEMVGTGLNVKLYTWVATAPFASVTLTVMLLAPAVTAVVPVITPVLALMLKPDGNVPEYFNDPAPPLAEIA
jgi:hypothetical protein